MIGQPRRCRIASRVVCGVGEGVKLEQQVLVTKKDIELLSMFPFEDALLG